VSELIAFKELKPEGSLKSFRFVPSGRRSKKTEENINIIRTLFIIKN
jgi:hypothetical protein